MTPRTAPVAQVTVVTDEALDTFARRKHWAGKWVSQVDVCLLLVQGLLTEDASRRLVGVRVQLDRVEYIRSELSQIVRNSKSEMHLLEHEHEMERARTIDQGVGGLTSRGMASDERLATYALRNRHGERRMAELRATLGYLVDCDRHVSAVIRSIDNHRMEAITMLRSQMTVSKEEVAAFRADS